MFSSKNIKVFVFWCSVLSVIFYSIFYSWLLNYDARKYTYIIQWIVHNELIIIIQFYICNFVILDQWIKKWYKLDENLKFI